MDNTKRLIPAWLLGIPLSYLMLGFLSNFYASPAEVGLLTLLIHSCVTLFVYYLLGRVKREFHSKPVEAVIAAALFMALSAFTWILFQMAGQFPRLFDAGFYRLEAGPLIYFIIGVIFSPPLAVWMEILAGKNNFQQSKFYRFLDEHLGGLMLAAFFFAVYLMIASIFNQPAFDADDIFFDADGRLWRWRFATEQVRDYYWRPVHPFVLLIIRPLVSVISFFLKGDSLYAAFILVALTGGLCVYLVWYFVKDILGNNLYALLIAALFGASAAQIVFSSLIETYIFLAAAALIFLALLLKDKPLPALVIAGLVAFGITISNFGQTVIAHILIKRDIKQWIRYGLIAAALVIPLTLLNNFIYPNSQPYFFDLSSYDREGHNSFPPTLQRANYLGRVMFLHSFVAPEPLVFKEEIPFLKVWMFRASIKKEPMRLAEYETWLDTSVVFLWIILILLGGILFLKNLRRQDNRFFLTLGLILLFNFALHLQYGKDVFLYAANWTYAIVLFLALAWRELAGKSWFQISLLIFIGLMLVNNSQLIETMLKASALHIK